MTYPTPKPGTGLNTIAFDLDGTLAEPTWPKPEIGEPILRAVDAWKFYANKGYELIVYTSRPAAHLEGIRAWLWKHDLTEAYDIVTDKPRAAMYVDDRAVTFPEAFHAEPRQMRYPWPNNYESHDFDHDCCIEEKPECVPA